ncbi:hypothetical protein QBC46DRAFT_381658 [Diplogelasinospora grovesii]|uniref:Isochorismatase-like domain-containing protein n=1 Tax=Diplogelasinospora grovesii TaxID=303347 RepID=A0AAN6S642_9PEZI|nr:hypothetical protein QBC46DRAFT_381658 [Diplogelasinospora grovesii]
MVALPRSPRCLSLFSHVVPYPSNNLKLTTLLPRSSFPPDHHHAYILPAQMASGKVKIVGGKNNFWIWSEDGGFDLTHPPKPTSPIIYPRVPLQTTKGCATIDPTKTALVVVDMQNSYPLSLVALPIARV